MTQDKIRVDINFAGDKYYYKNNELHREDGPAIDCVNGFQAWFLEGVRHREDGPAVIFDDNKFWYFRGKPIDCESQEEFDKAIRLRLFW